MKQTRRRRHLRPRPTRSQIHQQLRRTRFVAQSLPLGSVLEAPSAAAGRMRDEVFFLEPLA